MSGNCAHPWEKSFGKVSFSLSWAPDGSILTEIVPCSQTTSLFQRFQDDILAGRKTITIRDESESHFKTGDVLRVGRFEDDGYFCTIEVTATST